MTRRLSRLPVCFLLFAFLFVSEAFSLPPQEKFIRLNDKDSADKALQVAITDYSWKNGRTVSLVSAVHVADQEYFDELNKLLATYDVVLYELVAPKGVKPIQGMKRGGFMNSLQEWFADLLGASLQLDQVDYSSDHFVHADVSFEELVAEGARRGETALSLIIGVLSDMLAVQEEIKDLPFQPKTPADMLALWFNPSKLRSFVAHSLAYMSEDSEMNGMKSLEPYVIDLRNAKAVEVLKEQGAATSSKTFAIFYGAAHMKDLEERLVGGLGMTRKSTSWISAWDLSPKRQVVAQTN